MKYYLKHYGFIVYLVMATEVTPFDLVYGQEVVCDNPGFRGKKNLFCFKNLNHDFQSKVIFVILEKCKILFTK